MHIQPINFISILIIVAFVIRGLRNILYHLFLWQNKEYRLDRMLIHFRTKEGTRFLLGTFSSIKLLLLITFSVAIFLEASLAAQASIWLFGGVILAEAGKNLSEFRSNSLPLPVFSLKVILIFFITLFLQLLFIVTSSPRLALDYLPFLDRSLGAMVALQIGLFSIPARVKNELVKMLAREKLNSLSRLKVIGITGSYGKTSTKEFTAQLLAQEFAVVKTPANTNTAIGVATTILKTVNSDTDYFVMEAAAYKKGEIREIAGLVKSRLKIAVLTGINPQHLDLFKTLANIESAKYELIEGLGGKGVAIFNANNSRTRKLAQYARKNGLRVLLYGEDRRLFAYATAIKQGSCKLSFRLHLGRNKTDVIAPILGKHNIENILAAAIVAYESGIAWEKIIQGIAKLKPPTKTMNYKKKKNTVLIDDSYSANPEGVLAALEYLRVYKLPRILVLGPLIELSNEADRVHRRIGKKASVICDLIILTNRNYYESFNEGVKEGDREIKVIVGSGGDAKEFIEKQFKGKKVILFEGRESERVLAEYI